MDEKLVVEGSVEDERFAWREQEAGRRRRRSTYLPPLDDGDDVIDLNVELVGLVKVLQGAHVRGHRLRNNQKQHRMNK